MFRKFLSLKFVAVAMVGCFFNSNRANADGCLVSKQVKVVYVTNPCGYYWVYSPKAQVNEDNKDKKKSVQQGEASPTQREQGGGRDGAQTPAQNDQKDKTCAGDVEAKRTLINLQIDKLRLEIEALEHEKKARQTAEAGLGTALGAVPKVLELIKEVDQRMDDIRKTVQPAPQPAVPDVKPEPGVDLRTLNETLKNINASLLKIENKIK
jgi:hypothetical protein